MKKVLLSLFVAAVFTLPSNAATWTATEGRTSPYVAIRDNFSF